MENQNNQIQTPPPSNYLGGAIATTLLCCLPVGILAIVYAAKVDVLWYTGNQQAAIEASSKARMWMIVALIIGLIFWSIYIVLCIVEMVAGDSLILKALQ